MGKRLDCEWDYKKAKEAFKQSGRTRRWLASQCSVSSNYLSILFMGRGTPSLTVVQKMAEALEIELKTLLKDSAA